MTYRNQIEELKTPYDKIPINMINNPEYQSKVREIYTEERGKVIEGYETCKVRCVEHTRKIKKRTIRQRKKNKSNLFKRIDEMRKIIRWT